MTRTKHVLTRRDFIRTGSYAALGGLMLGLPVGSHAVGNQREKSRVVLIRGEKVIDGNGALQSVYLEDMLDQALQALLNAGDAAAAWKQLFKPDDIVGIKSNCWGPLPTPAILEEIIQARLRAIGIPQKNMAVEDRGVLGNSVFKQATALLNVRPLRTHHWSGLGTLLKNYIMFVPRPWMYHGNACEGLGAIWQKPPVKGKTRLNILVMLTPLFHGVGPHHFSSSYLWPYHGLILSTDPVAADAVGAGIIQAKRNAYFGKERPISPPPRHIAAADIRFGLGNSSPERIDLVRMGWEEEILI
jgi:hypothetical protein